MATSNATNIASTAKAVESTTNATVKTQRVLETRDQWAVIFNHTVSLVVALVKGEDMPDDPRKGFAFGKIAEQPHSRQYAQSLIGGFVSKKAGKVFAQTEGLDEARRNEIAMTILLKTKLGGGDATKAKGILSKAEPKQARAFAEAVLNGVQTLTAQKPASKGKGTRKSEKASK